MRARYNVPISCSPSLLRVNWSCQVTSNRTREKVSSHKNAKLTACTVPGNLWAGKRFSPEPSVAAQARPGPRWASAVAGDDSSDTGIGRSGTEKGAAGRKSGVTQRRGQERWWKRNRTCALPKKRAHAGCPIRRKTVPFFAARRLTVRPRSGGRSGARIHCEKVILASCHRSVR